MKKGRTFIRRLLFVLNIIASAGLVAAYCAGYISPEKAWLLAFFGLAYPIFLIINLVFFLFWLVLWKKEALLPLICILAGWSNMRALYPFRLSDPATENSRKIKVASYNVHSLYGIREKINIPGTRSKVADFLSGVRPDILCVQEFYASGFEVDSILSRFMRNIGLKYIHYRNYQEFSNKRKINAIATFSRYPVAGSGSFKLPDHSLYAIYSDLAIGRDTIRVYNLHLESIRFGEEDYSFYSHLTEPEKEKIAIGTGSRRMIWKLRKAFIIRSQEVITLKKHIAACPYPVILAGDFNDPPSSYTYHQLTSDLEDSFKAAGNRLFDGTYAGRLPSFRIDYILYSAKLKAVSYQKQNIGLSDHYPVVATLILK